MATATAGRPVSYSYVRTGDEYSGSGVSAVLQVL